MPARARAAARDAGGAAGSGLPDRCGRTRRLQPAPGRGGRDGFFLSLARDLNTLSITISARCRMSPPCCGPLPTATSRNGSMRTTRAYSANCRTTPTPPSRSCAGVVGRIKAGGRCNQYGGTGNFGRQHRPLIAHRAAGVQPRGNLVEHGGTERDRPPECR